MHVSLYKKDIYIDRYKFSIYVCMVMWQQVLSPNESASVEIYFRDVSNRVFASLLVKVFVKGKYFQLGDIFEPHAFCR